MQYAVILHPAEEGGYWSEVPALPGCCSQGETLDEAVANTRLAIDGWIDYVRGGRATALVGRPRREP